MPSPLLEAVAWTWLALSLASALGIVVDVLVGGNRQSMPVMEWVWPITALYFGPVALWAYLRYGRQYAPAYVAGHPQGPAPTDGAEAGRGRADEGTGTTGMAEVADGEMAGMAMADGEVAGMAGMADGEMAGMAGMADGEMAGMAMAAPDRSSVPHWVRVAISTSHCGSGCTLGDIAAEWLIFALGLTLFGAAIYASFLLDYLFALALGVVFQYFAITQMGTRGWGELVRRTAKADAYSLTAFEVGLFAWMALTYFVLFTSPHLTPTSPVFWFMMQLGMIIGFLTPYPANAWLIRRGVKEAM